MNANELADGILAIEERIFLTKKEHQLFQNSATMLRQQQAEIEALKADKALHDEAYLSQMKEIEALKIKLAEAIDAETDEEINVVAILQDAEIVPVGHEIWKTGEEFNKYKRIVLATAKALRKASEK